ncbi:MAG: DUF3604 domain-containing protein [Planctomycetota bacterium]|jgi:hypothetical protein
MRIVEILLAVVIVPLTCSAASAQERETNLYWGDTHLHTSYSGDAFAMQNVTADPDTAYRYAKGLPVVHPYHKARIRIGTPLDFLVVSDHAELMGVVLKLAQGDPLVAETETGKRFIKMMQEGRGQDLFFEVVEGVNTGDLGAISDIDSVEVRKGVWGDIVEAAERHNEPGKFTAFIGWEWSSIPNGANLHRVIFIREGADKGTQFVPFSLIDSDRPEDLWRWLDTTSKKTGANFVAITHNSNISKGLMFNIFDSDGNPISAEYARERMRWEPVAEITQIKGDSEAHPALSPTDEFADYETYDHFIEIGETQDVSLMGHALLKNLTDEQLEYVAKAGDYARSALKRGLVIEAEAGANPYKFGVIGSTDSHTAMASAEEDNFHGKMAIDSIPANKGIELAPGARGYDMSAAGLAAVWATENTREAIFDAFHRKEVYATTGPRIRVRAFGGWDFKPEDARSGELASVGYSKGVPMGGDLSPAAGAKAPSFLIQALKDPAGANLDRIQVIKGWYTGEGLPQEKIYNVALSDGRREVEGKVPPVGNTVDVKAAAYTNTIGDTQLATVWTDPDFDPDVKAFYYVRVLEIPTPRHTTYDAVALGVDPPEGYAATIQERAYTSPIWYTP